MSHRDSRFSLVFDANFHKFHKTKALAICALSLVGILMACQSLLAVQGTFLATANATVQSTGPRTGFNGTDFMNMESTANGTFASYGVVDIPLSASAFPGAVTGINSVTLQLTENNASFSAPGQISVFETSNTTVSIANTVTNGIPDSPLRYVVGPGNSNVNTATVGNIPPDGTNSLLPLSFLGSYQFTQTGSGNNGVVDSISLTFSPAQQADLISRIASGGTLRLVLTPDTPAPTLAAATYGGATNLNPIYIPKLAINAAVAGLPYWDPNGSLPGLGGPGVWSATGATFGDSTGTATPAAYDPTKYTVFNTSNHATVTVDPAGVSVGNVEFDTNGYVLKGGPLSSNTATSAISVFNAPETTTIKSKVTGSNGLTKIGNGTLVLAPVNSDSDFTGNVNINGGTLIITSDADLGNANVAVGSRSNTVSIGGGTLKVRASTFEMDAGRNMIGGGGGLSVLPGGTFTVDGPVNTSSAITLPVNETLILANSTRNLGGITFASLGLLQAGSDNNDATNVNQIIMNNAVSANSATGTTKIRGFVNFTGGRSITVATGGTLVITGGVSSNFAASSNLAINGGGTVDIKGDHSQLINALTLGSAGAAGPTYVIENVQDANGKNLSLGNTNPNNSPNPITMQFNSGTIQNNTGVTQTFDSLLTDSIGATGSSTTTTTGATFAGTNDMIFQGPVNLFKPVTGLNRINIANNNTTFSGGWTSTITTSSNVANLSPGLIIGASGSTSTGSLTLSGTVGLDLPTTVDTTTLKINSPMTSPAAAFTLTFGGKIVIGVDNAINPATTLTVTTSGGTLDLNGHSQTLAGFLTTSTASGTRVVTNNAASSTGTLVVAGGTNSYSGNIQDGAGGGKLVALSITGGANETLTGTNTFSGGLTINNGQATFSTATATIGGALQMGGTGSSTLTSNLATNSLSFTGTTLNAGASSITDTLGTVSLAGITRSVGSTAAISGSSVSTSAGVATGILTDNNVAYATFGTTDWAAKNGSTTIVALPAGSYTASTSNSLAGNADLAGDVTLPASTPTSISSLRYKLNDAAHSLNLGGNILTVGGILGSSANATAADALTISNGSLQSAGGGKDLVIIQNGTAPMTISAGIINNGSATGLTKSGSGEVILSGSNSYTGTTNVNAGKLTLSAASATSTGTIVLNGGTLSLNNASAIDGGGNLTFAGGALQFTSNNNPANNTGNTDYTSRMKNSVGPINIDTNNLASPVVFSGSPDSSNIGGLTKSGGGTLSLTASNGGFTGPVTLAGGTLSLGVAGTLPSSGNVIFTGGTLQYTASSATEDYSGRIVNSTGAISIDDGGQAITFGTLNTTTPTVNVSAFIGPTNSGGFTKLGSGTLTLLGANTFTGTTTVSSGTLLLANNSALGSSTLSTSGAGAIAFAQISAQAPTPNNVTTATFSVGGLTGSAGSGLVLQDNATPTPNPITLSVGGTNLSTAYNGNLSGSGSLTKVGTGTLTLTGTNNYTGPTTVGGGTGSTLVLTKRTALYGGVSANWTADKIIVSTNTNLQLNVGGSGEFTQADVKQLSGLGSATTGFITGAAIALDTTNASGGVFTYGNNAGETFGNPGGVLAVSKVGTGTLELSSANTFSGAMRLTAGTLKISDPNALQNSTLTPSASTTVSFNTGIGSVNLGALSSAQTLTLADLSGNPINLTLGTTFTTLSAATMSGNLVKAASGTNNVTKIGPGTQTLSGTDNYTGTTAIQAGTLIFGQPLSLYNNTPASWIPANISVSPGATLAVNYGTAATTFTAAQVGNLTTSGTLLGNLNSGGFGNGAIFGLSVASGTTIDYGSVLADTNGGANSLALAKLNTGTLSLSAANTYTGITNANAGVLLLKNANAVQNSTVTFSSTATTSPLAFDSSVAGGVFNIGGLAGFTATNFPLQNNASTPAPVTISVGGNNASTTFFGVMSGAGNFTKVGSGNLTLPEQQLYTGATTIGGTGSVILGVTNALTTTSGITLAGGTFSTGGIPQDFTINNGGLSPVALSVSSSSHLDLGAATSTTNVVFGDSHSATWAGGSVLTIDNWTYGTDHLFFGLTSGGLTATQLGKIKFADFAQGASISTDPSNLAEVTPQIGDINQDGVVNVADISALMKALSDVGTHANALTEPNSYAGLHQTLTDSDIQFELDVNRDGAANNADIQALINEVANGSVSLLSSVPVAVPEPASLLLLGLGSALFVAGHARRKVVRAKQKK